MAASDPATHVATPTGVLLGVAAFSWDGSAWQPAGRASPDVATSTGALQGVAPFTWDGSAWQPSGRAGPGVATPTGVLNGAAVYTWSGSAWTPAGAQYAPSTPSGALRGIAAFSWDGSAWQPAAQAGPSVATPYGVLTGVAMFNWNGTAWQPGGALPAGATLDLSFVSAGTLDPRITFTRASTATYIDATGTMQTAAVNAPRWDYDPVTHALRGLLIEEARTNLLLNSATLGTQSVAVTAQTYTLAFYGTGTITKSGTATGALVGTGATQRVSQTFTPTAGTLTLTVTGTATNAQLEAGSFATSYVPTTGAAVTRANETCTMPVAAWFDQTKGSLQFEYIIEGSPVGYGAPMALVGANSNNDVINLDQFNGATSTPTTPMLSADAITVGGTAITNTTFADTPMPAGALQKGATAWALNGAMTGAHNGILATPSGAGSVTSLPTITALELAGQMHFQLQPSLWARRVRYWPRALSAAELQSVTT